MKKPDFHTAARRFVKSGRYISWIILAAGAISAGILFSYTASSFPLSLRLRGDAYEYMTIAYYALGSLRDAFTYVGDRTYGFPLFLYIVRVATSANGWMQWVTAVAYCQFALHIGACFCFYIAFLKGVFKKAGLPTRAAAVAAALLLTYPTMVTYATVPETDTFSADLLMLAAAASFARRKTRRPAVAFILCGLCGLLLGYAVMVRPSLIMGIAAFYGASFYELAINRKWRTEAAGTALMTAATLALMLPALWSVWQAQSRIGLQDQRFVQQCVPGCMQAGLSAVRVAWSYKYLTHEPLPGVRDPYLDKVYGKKCTMDPAAGTVDSAVSLARCLLSQPQALPLYFGKKAIAIFDVPILQQYTLDWTPRWFIVLERIFGTLAFCGFISLLIMAGERLLPDRKPVWIGLPWAALVFALMLLHSLFHIEGRYGFPMVPFCLSSLFLGFAGARQAGGRFYAWWIAAMLVSAACFVYQVCSWDFVTPV